MTDRIVRESCGCGAELTLEALTPAEMPDILTGFRIAHDRCRTTPTVELTSPGDDLADAIRHVQNMNYNEVAILDLHCTCETQDAEVAHIYGNHHIRSCPLYIPHTTVQRTTS